MAFEKVIAEAKERGYDMPSTRLNGYIYQWVDNVELTDEQNEKSHEWMVDEINRVLPDYARWFEKASQIILPIDKVDEFCDNVDWDEILEMAYNNYLAVKDKIINGES